MTDKKKGTPSQESVSNQNIQQENFTPFTKQKLLVKNALVEAGSRGISSLELQEKYGVAHPPARILELRQEGLSILTRIGPDQDSFGRARQVGRYFLISLPKRIPGVSS